MSELTYTVIRYGLLALLWLFVLSLAAVLRRDIYGTRVSGRAQRLQRRAGRSGADQPGPNQPLTDQPRPDQPRTGQRRSDERGPATEQVPGPVPGVSLAGAGAAVPAAGAGAGAAGTAGAGAGAGAAARAAGASGGSGRGRRRREPTSVVVTEGRLAGTSLPLGRHGVLIGRAPECSLVLDDEFASSRHARIFPHADGWFVEDQGSRNGTSVNGVRITGPVPVQAGAVIRVGRTSLELRG